MRIRIEGTDLPGPRDADPLRFADLHVGVQRGSAVVGLVPATAGSAEWDLEVTSREVDGLLDVGGPYVHGRPGARFLYLSWCVGGSMFRRAKLMFADVPSALLRAAHDDDVLLVAALGLTGADGTPRGARVGPPDVSWRVG